MKRTTAREIAIQVGFAAASNKMNPAEVLDNFFDHEHYDTLSSEDELFSEYPNAKQMDYIRRLVTLIAENLSVIDGYIEMYSKGWKIERISRTALAVMRCAICEIIYMDDIPNSAAINEAVELCKGYDEPDTVAFVNGVLGGFMRGQFGEKAAEEVKPAAEAAETEKTEEADSEQVGE